VARAETAVTEIVARVKIIHGNLREALPQSNGDGRFAANAERFAVFAKPVVALRLPIIAPTNAPTSLLEYRTQITLSAELGVVRHGQHESVVNTWILRSTRGPLKYGIN